MIQMQHNPIWIGIEFAILIQMSSWNTDQKQMSF